jgi:cold shock CspA family protein
VLLDDGTTLRFAAAALEGTGLRLLRRGQRVRLEVEERDGDGAVTVTRVQIHTLP